MGVLADRTQTRWGKFRHWIRWTAGPWAVAMVLAYCTPEAWSMGMLIAYATITTVALITLYSMTDRPYSALNAFAHLLLIGDLPMDTPVRLARPSSAR